MKESRVLEGLLRFGFGLGGLANLTSGIWMIAAPQNWYEMFPGGIADTGPANLHFVADLGGWYVAGGLLLLFALTNPTRFGGVALIVLLTAFGVHAGVHISDLLTGRLPTAHWVIDTPLVFLPVTGFGILLWIWWSLQTQRHSRLGPRRGAEEEEVGSGT